MERGKGMNKVMLIGRVGRDPELRYTADGAPVATFGLATSKNYKDKSGEKQERTEWHNIVIWRKLAEVAAEHVKKGTLLSVEGEIQSREYDDREGVKHKVYEIVVRDLEILSWPDRNSSSQGRENKGGAPAARKPKPGADNEFPRELDDDDVPM